MKFLMWTVIKAYRDSGFMFIANLFAEDETKSGFVNGNEIGATSRVQFGWLILDCLYCLLSEKCDKKKMMCCFAT